MKEDENQKMSKCEFAPFEFDKSSQGDKEGKILGDTYQKESLKALIFFQWFPMV